MSPTNANMAALAARLRKRAVRVHDLSGVGYNDDEDCHMAADVIEKLIVSDPAVRDRVTDGMVEAGAKALVTAKGTNPMTLFQFNVFTGDEPFDHEDDTGRRFIYAWRKQVEAARAALVAAAALRTSPPEPASGSFQDRVANAHEALFHDDPTDLNERRDRFYEEATETAQSLGMTEDAAHQLVAYTFGRPPGDVRKEIGAAALTLASLCVIGGWDMMACAEADLAALQMPGKIAKVRAKRATRHGRGPLPGLSPKDGQ